MLSFDHASLEGPMDAPALAGLRLTPTPADGRHARIHLQRSYLEVRAQRTHLRGAGWFLRARAPDSVKGWLASRGVSASEPERYEGADGVWSDIAVGPGGLGPAAPIVTHRLDTSDWPPRLDRPHPNRAVTVVALELSVPDPGALGDLLQRLGARRAPEVADGPLAFGSVEVTLVAAGRPGLSGIVLGCAGGGRLPLDLAGDP